MIPSFCHRILSQNFCDKTCNKIKVPVTKEFKQDFDHQISLHNVLLSKSSSEVDPEDNNYYHAKHISFANNPDNIQLCDMGNHFVMVVITKISCNIRKQLCDNEKHPVTFEISSVTTENVL